MIIIHTGPVTTITVVVVTGPVWIIIIFLSITKHRCSYYSNYQTYYQTYLLILIENAKDVINETCSFSDCDGLL